MAWQTPRTWVTGEIVTAAHLNQDVRDNTGFLFTPPSVRAFKAADQTGIADTTDTAVVLDSEDFDTDTMHDTATNNTRLTFTTAGKYMVGAAARWDGNITGGRIIGIRDAGSTFRVRDGGVALGGDFLRQSVSQLDSYAATDYVEAVLRQNSGGTRSIVAEDGMPNAWAVWVSN